MATKEHCFYCFDVLSSHFDEEAPPRPSFTNDSYPLFVTWNIVSTRRGQSPRLRGCIGNFEPMPLHSGLKTYALTSALDDHRFDPILPSEMVRLECCVSLLDNFERQDHYLDWDIETHGIWISFKIPGSSRTRTATYLPDVVLEQGWTKIEAIDSLLRKGGYHGRITDEFRESIQLTTYISSKERCTYDEWQMSKQGSSSKN